MIYNNIVEAARDIRLPRQGNWTPPKEYKEVVKQIRNEYARKSFGYDYDDLEQELWVKVYELYDSDPSPEYLAVCLRNHINNWFKIEIRYKEMFKSRPSFEGTAEETLSAIELPSPKITGHVLKTYLIAFHLYPQGLSVEMHDYISKIYFKLNATELTTLDNYANEHTLTSKDKMCMSRMIDRYSE